MEKKCTIETVGIVISIELPMRVKDDYAKGCYVPENYSEELYKIGEGIKSVSLEITG